MRSISDHNDCRENYYEAVSETLWSCLDLFFYLILFFFLFLKYQGSNHELSIFLFVVAGAAAYDLRHFAKRVVKQKREMKVWIGISSQFIKDEFLSTNFPCHKLL